MTPQQLLSVSNSLREVCHLYHVLIKEMEQAMVEVLYLSENDGIDTIIIESRQNLDIKLAEIQGRLEIVAFSLLDDSKVKH